MSVKRVLRKVCAYVITSYDRSVRVLVFPLLKSACSDYKGYTGLTQYVRGRSKIV